MKHIKKISSGLFILIVLLSSLTVSALAAGTRKCYTLSAENTPVYSDSTLNVKIGSIFGSDEVTVLEVTGSWCRVSYPISGGRTKTGYIRTSAILLGTGGESYTARAKITTSRRPGGAAYGYIATGDPVTVLGTIGAYTQVKYPVSGGYKYALIPTSAANQYIYPNSRNSSATNKQQRMANAALAMVGKTGYSGYCQKFVRIVGESIGLPSGSAGSAIEACNKWRVSTDRNIPLGAAVYLRSKNTSSAGYKWGHVGIHVGNGNIVHAQSKVRKDNLSDLLNNYTYLGWGWQAGSDLRK